MGPNYKNWMDYELRWLAGYRKKLMRTTTHVTIPQQESSYPAVKGVLRVHPVHKGEPSHE